MPLTFNDKLSFLVQRGFCVMKTITHQIQVNAPVEAAYQAYRNYYGLSHKMDAVQTVEIDANAVEGKTLQWKVKTPTGIPLQWTARVLAEVENQSLTWGESEDSAIKTNGKVLFSRIDQNTCNVAVECNYNFAGSDMLASIGEIVANPQTLLEENLMDYKRHVESVSGASQTPTTSLNDAYTGSVQPVSDTSVSVPYART
jgi:uncharacterized membrane protein